MSEYDMKLEMARQVVAERARQQSAEAATAEIQATIERKQAEEAAKQRRAELIEADRADREALRRLRAQIEEHQLKLRLRQTWRGTAAQFEAEWPRLAQGQQEQTSAERRQALEAVDRRVGRFSL